MYKGIQLPISKSIANRLLLLQAIHGDPLMRVSSDMPDDVIILHNALEQLRAHKKGEPLTLYLQNCGTALRFLQVHIAKCYPGEPITLTGDSRLMERDGAPTSQTTSARILHGEDIPVAPDESPYITMSRRLRELYIAHCPFEPEYDWSSAAFWYEYIAIHGGELRLEGLTKDSLQGDKIVADIYAKFFGVQTEFVDCGAVIRSISEAVYQPEGRSVFCQPKAVSIDFSNCPDLYPVVALTCERLGIALKATGIERLRYKESDRIEAVRLHEVHNDHRMAMALMAADFPVSKSDQQCIAKSYPGFADLLHTIQHPTRRSADGEPTVVHKVVIPTISHVTPIRGVNDDNLGKKHALSKLIHAANSEYVWLHDDDVILPKAVNVQSDKVQSTKDKVQSDKVQSTKDKVQSTKDKVQSTKDKVQSTKADLIILPLRMESKNEKPSLLEKLQIAEYAAIQELTIRTAKKGKAVMCSGANLIVKREVWLACEKELHPEIPSGDDMFLLEAVKRHGYKIAVIDEPDYTAVVRPLTSWKAFFRQRMRWAGKAPKYTDRDIIRCGRLVAAANIAQLLCPPIILIKFPIEYSLIRKREKKSFVHFLVALILELLYPFYLLICLIGGLFRKEW